MKHTCRIITPLGDMIALSEREELCGLWFVGQKHGPVDTGAWMDTPGLPLFKVLREQLAGYFSGKLSHFNLPIAPHGTPFQLAVWELLRAISPGETTTYGSLARELAMQREGRHPAPQAVGGAVGRNPITIIIPCHRVLGADGSLTGYAGGLDRKVALLTIEQRGPGGSV